MIRLRLPLAWLSVLCICACRPNESSSGLDGDPAIDRMQMELDNLRSQQRADHKESLRQEILKDEYGSSLKERLVSMGAEILVMGDGEYKSMHFRYKGDIISPVDLAYDLADERDPNSAPIPKFDAAIQALTAEMGVPYNHRDSAQQIALETQNASTTTIVSGGYPSPIFSSTGMTPNLANSGLTSNQSPLTSAGPNRNYSTSSPVAAAGPERGVCLSQIDDMQVDVNYTWTRDAWPQLRHAICDQVWTYSECKSLTRIKLSFVEGADWDAGKRVASLHGQWNAPDVIQVVVDPARFNTGHGYEVEIRSFLVALLTRHKACEETRFQFNTGEALRAIDPNSSQENYELNFDSGTIEF